MLNPYEIMYDAKMTVYRWQPVEVDGYTKHQKVAVVTGRRCRYSSSGQTEIGTPNPAIQNKHLLFCSLDTDIQEGDLAEITLRTGKVVKVKVGECHPYTYQWQCRVERDEDA